MSTNVAHNPQGAGRHYTVAELVARERAAAVRARATQRIHQPMSEPTRRIAPVAPQQGSGPDQQGMHVTDLLRREGVGENTQTAPPVLTAKPQKDRSRASMFSRAAVLFGLTVGGMVGLQSTVADTPDSSPGPVDSGGVVAAPQQIDQRASTSETKTEAKQEPSGGGGGASPTTSSGAVLRDHASELPAQPAQGPAGGAGSASGAAGGGSADTAAPAPTTTQAPAPTTANPNSQPDGATSQSEQQDRSSAQQDTQQQQTQEQQQESSQTQEPESDDNNNDDDGLLDPVTGVVSGVLDAGGGLLGG